MASEPIRWRARAGALDGFGLALAFAVVISLLATVERWSGLDRPPAPGEIARVTVRLPEAPAGGDGRVLIARGEQVTPGQARVARLLDDRQPALGQSLGGRLVAFTLAAAALLAVLRGGRRGKLLRVQATTLILLTLLCAAMKVVLLLTPASSLLAPVAAVVLLLGLLVDGTAGLAAAVSLGLIVAGLGPFDAPAAVVLAAQGVGAALALGGRKDARSVVLAGVCGGAAAGCAYAATYLLYAHGLPGAELADPLRAPLVAAVAGGVLAVPLALAARGVVDRTMGGISRARLNALARFDQPLLAKIASGAPGTWQHSLAMAGMAEQAAAAIGADAQLTRVGACYHDLGKTARPDQYVENLAPGQPGTDAPVEAAFAHVIEGVRLARAGGLPEAIVDFIHMHHGGGILGGVHRYPGQRPQSRETAILAICDAAEAAARTLRQPDTRAVDALVERVVYGKLHQGQLDESGLSLADLRAITASLSETLRHAHHARAAGEGVVDESAVTHRFVQPAALDSAEAPRPVAALAAAIGEDKVETATTRPLRPPPERLPTPPPLPGEIELFKDDVPAAASPDDLTPGTLVLGPPPATHPPDEETQPMALARTTPALPPQSMTPPKRRT